MAFKKCLLSALLEDECAKILFQEVNACFVGSYDRVGVGPRKGDEMLGTG